MKKLAIALALAIVLSLGLSVVSNAYVNGVRDRYEWTVPKINPENPAIVFDGDVDLEGEWKGAVCVTLDASPNSDTYEEVTLWSPAVWTGGAYDFNTFDEMDDAFKITINLYYLWDDEGLYVASTCDNLTAYNGHTVMSDYIKYFEYASGVVAENPSYTTTIGHSWEPMIYYGTEPTSGYHWPYFWIGTVEGGDAWADFAVTSASNWETTAYTAEAGNPDKDNSVAKRIRSVSTVSDVDAEGYRHWDLEIFLPWDYLNGGWDEEGNYISDRADLGKAGDSFAIGSIWAVRNAADDGALGGIRVRMSQTMGWANPDIYYLSATPAEKSDKVVEDTTTEVVEDTTEEVEEDTTTEVVEDTTTEEVEEDTTTEEVEDTTEEAPAPSTNPSTADVSVLFYALAAISAIGGISVFKRK